MREQKMEEHKFILTLVADNKEIEIKITQASAIAPINWDDLTASDCLHLAGGKVKVVTSPKKLVLFGDNMDQIVIILEGAGLDNDSSRQGRTPVDVGPTIS